jgi:nucleotide sugar dehydrogenase
MESVAPDGSRHAIPTEAGGPRQFEDIARRSQEFRARGAKTVVVQGLGFVGAAVAAVIAGARDAAGRPAYFVIGVDLATPGSYWKVAKINAGETPIASPDPDLGALIAQGACATRNLVATVCEDAYGIADTIVVDLPLDVTGWDEGTGVEVGLGVFEQAVRTIGRRMRADALVVIETTVPVGACAGVALPILREERARRGITQPVLLAHAYERVMPGPKYVDSIRRFWRSYSGVDAPSAAAAGEFLGSFIDTREFPLRELPDTASSEMAKLLENSYRAANIALIHEWALLAEKVGVNLFEVVESIRVRKGTHDNLRYPGFGVGGYCLTKDSLLAQWSAGAMFATGVTLGMTLEALRINRRMPLHTFDLALELAGGSLAGWQVLTAGVAYLPEVADTRNSPTEILVDELARAGAAPVVHDPHLRRWPERPSIPVAESLAGALETADGLILAVPHRAYREAALGGPRLKFVVDAQNLLDEGGALRLHRQGIRVAGVGKGHWRRLGY